MRYLQYIQRIEAMNYWLGNIWSAKLDGCCGAEGLVRVKVASGMIGYLG